MCEPELWVEKYSDTLFAYALQRVRDSQVAEDLVQETFLSALQAQHTFSGKSSESTWLVGILKFKIIDVYRSQTEKIDDDEYLKREISLDAVFENGAWKPHARPKERPKPHPMSDSDFAEVLELCLKGVKGKAELAFRLKYVEGLSTEEAMKSLEVSEGNYWVLIHRAKQWLRPCLEKKWK